MKARGRRPSAFIVSRCLEPLMKNEARVFDMAYQTRCGNLVELFENNSSLKGCSMGYCLFVIQSANEMNILICGHAGEF